MPFPPNTVRVRTAIRVRSRAPFLRLASVTLGLLAGGAIAASADVPQDPRAATPPARTAEASATDSARVRSGSADQPRSDSASSARIPGPVEYLWVVRTTLTSPEAVDDLLARAEEMGVRGLLVQVVGRGDAFYESTVLPRSESLPRTKPGETAFDPLGYLTPRAHARGLEVHAWVNTCLVWSSPRRPVSPDHVLNAHPEWVARLRDGRSMAALSTRQRTRLGLEGIFLSPGHPGVRTWVASVAQEIARQYPVDGLHLDYIRHPAVEIGYDATTRARFALEAGVDISRPWTVPKARRAAVDSAWRAFRSERVTDIVREVRDSLDALRPGIALSAAVIADTLTAERYRAQEWRAWLRTGLLDRAYVMTYAPLVQTVLDQLLAFSEELGAADRIVPGIALYNTSAATTAAKIKGARALGYRLLALYSYDALFLKPAYWPALRGFLDDAGTDIRP